jgi:hypothetical protein
MPITKQDLKKEIISYKLHLAHEMSQNRGDLIKLKIHDEVDVSFSEIQRILTNLLQKL